MDSTTTTSSTEMQFSRKWSTYAPHHSSTMYRTRQPSHTSNRVKAANSWIQLHSFSWPVQFIIANTLENGKVFKSMYLWCSCSGNLMALGVETVFRVPVEPDFTGEIPDCQKEYGIDSYMLYQSYAPNSTLFEFREWI